LRARSLRGATAGTTILPAGRRVASPRASRRSPR
jgi:hypothetical protein